jgi:hypothetical protein
MPVLYSEACKPALTRLDIGFRKISAEVMPALNQRRLELVRGAVNVLIHTDMKAQGAFADKICRVSILRVSGVSVPRIRIGENLYNGV